MAKHTNHHECNQYAWNSAATLVPLILGVVGLAITIVYECRLAKHPFLQQSLFKDMGCTVTYLAAVAQGIVVCRQFLLFMYCIARP